MNGDINVKVRNQELADGISVIGDIKIEV